MVGDLLSNYKIYTPCNKIRIIFFAERESCAEQGRNNTGCPTQFSSLKPVTKYWQHVTPGEI